MSSHLIIISVSFAIIKYLVIPLQDSIWNPLIKQIVPHFLLDLGYDVESDQTLTIMMISAILGYVVMSGLCSCLDLFSPHHWKTQGARSYMDFGTWLKVVAISLSNMFFCSWFILLPVWYIHKHGIFRGGSPLTTFTEPLDPLRCILNMIAHSVIIDIWFYTTHRILHWGIFYKHIHKMHHLFKAPTAVACMFAHPIEFCLGNVCGVILGPALTNAHPYECAFWMAFSLASTSGAHSGYPAFGAQRYVFRSHSFLSCRCSCLVCLAILLSFS